MKRRIQITFLLLTLFLSFSSFVHPLKVSASLIEYDPDKKTIRVESKVFIDDFLKSIANEEMDVNKLSDSDKLAIEAYYKESYIIKINGKETPLKYSSSDVDLNFNVLTIKFEETALTVKKRDKIEIINRLLFNEFGFLQSNRMELRFPPFFNSAYVECTKVRDNFLHTFK